MNRPMINLTTMFKPAAFLAAALLTGIAGAAPQSKVALTGARIVPVVGDEIESGTILIEDGRITAVAAEVEVPYDAMEIDCSGKVIFPGMMNAHSTSGLDVQNENLPVAPFLDVFDAIDPSRLDFEDALRDGVTSMHVIQGNNCVIGGLSRLVHPIGMQVEEMTQARQLALKMSASPRSGYDRMRQMAVLRETFFELDDYLEQLAESKYEESLKKKDKKMDVGPAEAAERGRELIEDDDYDDAHANLVRLMRGELAAWIYCGSAQDVVAAIAIATDRDFLDQCVFVLGGDAFKASRELRRADRPVVLDANLTWRERDEMTGEVTETFVPEVIRKTGVDFALLPSRDASMAERYLNYQAAVCVRNGMKRDDAIEAITINPARMLGVDDRYGSIEVGKVANLVVFSGDPLDFRSWVEMVMINGIKAYDRADDFRLTEILELETLPAQEDEADEAGADADGETEAAETEAEAEGGSEGEGDESGAETDPPAEAGEGEGGDETPRRGRRRRGGGTTLEPLTSWSFN